VFIFYHKYVGDIDKNFRCYFNFFKYSGGQFSCKFSDYFKLFHNSISE
jgi:hypothetical protein